MANDCIIGILYTNIKLSSVMCVTYCSRYLVQCFRVHYKLVRRFTAPVNHISSPSFHSLRFVLHIFLCTVIIFVQQPFL